MSGERGVSVYEIAEGERCVEFQGFGTFNGVDDFEAEGVGDVDEGELSEGEVGDWSNVVATRCRATACRCITGGWNVSIELAEGG
jgi:hypothetical protein